MNRISNPIEQQYYKPQLYEDIIDRLKDQGFDLNNLSRFDIEGVDQFHVRGAEVSQELIRQIHLSNALILDVGCGIGGPGRMLAEEFNCKVSGIDISLEYIRTATKLSELVGLNDKTEFIQADALNLPFADGTYDMVWTQHVQMNIHDKAKFYSEINRVLKDEGTFIYYDIFSSNGQDVYYPVPWADTSSVSFLGNISEMHEILNKLGFEKIHTKDQTQAAAEFLITLFEKIKQHGPPKLGLNVLMGDSTKEKLGNILKGLEEGKIVLQSGIYRK